MDELRIKFISDPGAESDNTVICGGFQRLRGAATGSRLKREDSRAVSTSQHSRQTPWEEKGEPALCYRHGPGGEFYVSPLHRTAFSGVK